MTTDTPRTDAEWASTWQTERRLHELCLQLERELAISLENQLKTQAEVERLTDQLHDCLSFIAFHGAVGATPDTAKLLENRILATLNK